MWSAPSFRHMTAGGALISFAGYGVGGFAQPYFIRNFHLGLAEVGLIFGLVAGYVVTKQGKIQLLRQVPLAIRLGVETPGLMREHRGEEPKP